MYPSLKQNSLSLIAVALLALVALGVWYWGHPGLVRTTGGGASAIFSVASSSGTTYFTVTNDGKVGVGTGDPRAQLDVAGAIRIGASAEGCGAGTAGQVAYNPGNGHFWGCDGYLWHQLDN